jgi:hypothetical protein
MNGKDYKEILLTFPGERQQKIAESTETIKEDVYKSGEFPSRYTSTSYHHQPYEALVSAMHDYIDSLLKRARADLDSGNLGPYDIEFLLNDVIKRLQDQVDYASSTVEAFKGVKSDESPPQFVRENKRF